MKSLHFILLLVGFSCVEEIGSVRPHGFVARGHSIAIQGHNYNTVQHADIALVKAVTTFFIGTGIIGRNKHRPRPHSAADIRIKGRDNKLFRGLAIDPQQKLRSGAGDISIILNNALHNPKRLLLKSKNKDCVTIARRALRTDNSQAVGKIPDMTSPFVLDRNALSLLANRCSFDTSRRYKRKNTRRNSKNNVNRRGDTTSSRRRNTQKSRTTQHSHILPPKHNTTKHKNAPSSYGWYDPMLPFGSLW